MVRARYGLWAIAVCGAPAPGVAADWSMQSAAQVFVSVESNPRMLHDDSTNAQAGVADVSVNLLRRTELLDLSINAHGSIRRYTEDVSLDRDDQQLDVRLQRRGERFVLITTAAATRDTTLTSELGTTGIIEDNQRHHSLSAELAPTWQLTERTTAGATVGWQQSRYAQTQQTPLVNYDYRSLGLNVAYDFSEQSSIGLVAGAGRLSRVGNDLRTDNVDVRLQVQHVWSPRWRGTISGGPSRVRTEGRGAGGSVFGATLVHAGERWNADATVERGIAPTGRGYLSRRDEGAVHLRAALLEHLEGAASFSLIRTRDYVPRLGFTLSDVRYQRAELSLAWRFAPDWNLGLAAGTSQQKLMFNNSTGRNHEARLQIAWRRAAFAG